MKKALVTGGASGIGAAIVELLRGEGWDVVALDVAEGPGVTVGDAADVPYDLYDLVFLNAGIIGQPGPVWGPSSDDVWRVNWQAPRRAVQTLIPGWLAAGHNGKLAAGLTGEFAEAFQGFVERGAPTPEVARTIVDGARARKFLIVTHPQSIEGVVPRVESMLTGEEPARPSGRRMDALFQTKY